MRSRYVLHSPNEIVSTADLDATVRLIAAFCKGLDGSADFTPR